MSGINPVSSGNEFEDQKDSSKSIFCWWRSAKEFNENGKLELDFSNLSALTPRLKILREMERLALVALESLDERRNNLRSYRTGEFWSPRGGMKKEDMDIPPIITILLVGLSGSGKSSLINLMYSVLGRYGLIPFAQTSGKSLKYTTMIMEEHNVLTKKGNGFCVYDSRGFDYNKIDKGLEELMKWMVHGVHHNQLCRRDGDDAHAGEGPPMSSVGLSSSRYVRRRVNCALMVANIEEIYKGYVNGDMKPLEATKALFQSPALRKCNENPILILTHGDMLSTEQRIKARLKICESLDISECSGAYDVVCLSEHGFLANESDKVTAYALCEALYRALIFSDQNHPPKRNIKDRILLLVSWFMCVVSAFFGCLAFIFIKLSRKADKMKLH